MIRRGVPLLVLLCFCLPVLAQNMGDQYTAGFTGARTYANHDLTDFRPPLAEFETINLTGITNATSLAVFEDQFLVGQGGATITYKMFTRVGSSPWTQTMPGTGATLKYTPSFAANVVILGGEATTTIRAVNVSTGATIWSDDVGNTAGRFPLITDDKAIYAGQNRLAVKRLDGTLIWQTTGATTAQAAVAESPLAVWGTSLYFINGGNKVAGVDLEDGSALFPPVGGAEAGSSLIANEKYLFVTIPSQGVVVALDARTGELIWDEFTGTLSTSPGIALANGRLFVFRSNNGEGISGVDALDPDTGASLWSVQEEGAGIQYGLVADKVLYYFHEATERIRARDVSTGALLWSIPRPNVRGLSAVEKDLVVLLPTSIRLFRPLNQIYMAQVANGGGQTTLVTLSNTTPNLVAATVEFFNNSGAPLSIPVVGLGSVTAADISVPAHSSVKVQTEDTGSGVVVGWIRVNSNGLLRGASIFQFSESGDITREAAVADALPIGAANVFVAFDGVFDTGVAIANPTDEATVLRFKLLNNLGVQVGDTLDFDLGSLAHVATFVSELFPDEVGESFEGTLVIESVVPVSIAALRTKGGLQLSSYPVGQAVR